MLNNSISADHAKALALVEATLLAVREVRHCGCWDSYQLAGKSLRRLRCAEAFQLEQNLVLAQSSGRLDAVWGTAKVEEFAGVKPMGDVAANFHPDCPRRPMGAEDATYGYVLRSDA